MQPNYAIAIKQVLLSEGGYTNDADDPGGPTNWGITIYDARAYWRADATAADVRAMPIDVAQAIYKEKYWDAIDGDELPAGVDYAVFDYGVNSGISRAMKVLQRIIGTRADGHIGPKTMDAVKKAVPADVIAALCDERLSFLQSLHTWPVFGRGWGRRVREVRATALALAEEVNTAAAMESTPAAIPGQA